MDCILWCCEKDGRPCAQASLLDAKERSERPPSFILDSFEKVNLHDADLVFMNSVTFPEEVLEQVAERARCLPPSAKIVTAKTLLGHFKSTGSCWARVSWSDEAFEYTVQQVERPMRCEPLPQPLRSCGEKHRETAGRGVVVRIRCGAMAR